MKFYATFFLSLFICCRVFRRTSLQYLKVSGSRSQGPLSNFRFHSQSGYSLSGFISGSCPFFIIFAPQTNLHSFSGSLSASRNLSFFPAALAKSKRGNSCHQDTSTISNLTSSIFNVLLQYFNGYLLPCYNSCCITTL